jgi:hypothetical protein
MCGLLFALCRDARTPLTNIHRLLGSLLPEHIESEQHRGIYMFPAFIQMINCLVSYICFKKKKRQSTVGVFVYSEISYFLPTLFLPSGTPLARSGGVLPPAIGLQRININEREVVPPPISAPQLASLMGTKQRVAAAAAATLRAGAATLRARQTVDAVYLEEMRALHTYWPVVFEAGKAPVVDSSIDLPAEGISAAAPVEIYRDGRGHLYTLLQLDHPTYGLPPRPAYEVLRHNAHGNDGGPDDDGGPDTGAGPDGGGVGGWREISGSLHDAQHGLLWMTLREQLLAEADGKTLNPSFPVVIF